MEKNFKKLINNDYFFSFLNKIFLVLIGLTNSIFLNRFLGPTVKGEYSFLLSILNFLVLFLNLGIYQTYPYFKKNSLFDSKNIYFNLMFIQFLFYSLITIFIFIFSNSLTLKLISGLIPLSVFSIQLSFIAMVENFRLKNVIYIVSNLIYTISIIIAFLFLPNVVAIPILLLYFKDILIILTLLFKFKFKFTLFRINLTILFKVIRFGFFPMLSAFLITANYQIDILILNLFVNFEQIGFYSVGIGLAGQAWVITDSLKEVFFSKSIKQNLVKEIVFGIKMNLYLILVIISLFYIFGRHIILFLYGAEFINSYIVTIILFIGVIPMIFFKLINTSFLVEGNSRLSFIVLSISVVLNVLLNFLFIGKYGIIGAALASVVSYSFCGIIYLLIFASKNNINILNFFWFNKSDIIIIMGFINK
jgi:O-antigen/teichoic acid export membrane protein